MLYNCSMENVYARDIVAEAGKENEMDYKVKDVIVESNNEEKSTEKEKRLEAYAEKLVNCSMNLNN